MREIRRKLWGRRKGERTERDREGKESMRDREKKVREEQECIERASICQRHKEYRYVNGHRGLTKGVSIHQRHRSNLRLG